MLKVVNAPCRHLILVAVLLMPIGLCASASAGTAIPLNFWAGLQATHGIVTKQDVAQDEGLLPPCRQTVVAQGARGGRQPYRVHYEVRVEYPNAGTPSRNRWSGRRQSTGFRSRESRISPRIRRIVKPGTRLPGPAIPSAKGVAKMDQWVSPAELKYINAHGTSEPSDQLDGQYLFHTIDAAEKVKMPYRGILASGLL